MDRGSAARTVARIVRLAGLLAPLLFVAGCIVQFSHPGIGVEFAPDADGWKDELRIHEFPWVQFRWQDEEVAVEIATFASIGSDPTYIAVHVHNHSDEAARILVHGDSPGITAGGEYEVLTKLEHGGAGTVGTFAEDRWIDIPAHRVVRFRLDDLPWLSDPAAGDRIDASVEIERRGQRVTCPLRFHVARVFRKD